MHRSFLLVAALAWLGSACVRAEDNARALIERARRATAGGPWLNTPLASHERTKGTLKVKRGVEPLVIPFTAKEYTQAGPRLRFEFDQDYTSYQFNMLLVVDRDKGWRRKTYSSGEKQQMELSEKEVALQRAFAHQDRVIQLIGLLENNRFTLKSLGESVVEGKTIQGVKVSCKDQEDTYLYFDKATGLLTREHHRSRDTQKLDELLELETTFLDYRPMDTGAEEEVILTGAGVDISGPALTAWLRKQTPTPAARAKAKKLVEQLGANDFGEREQASKELLPLGAAAVPALEKASHSEDAEVRRRARTCLNKIKHRNEDAVTIAAVHLLALRRPAGAVPALLDLLPAASTPVAHEVRAALYHLGAATEKPDPALQASLKDADPARRAAAAAALETDGGAYARLPNRRVFRLGFKVARKIVFRRSDRRSLELELVQKSFFNRCDDKLFAQP